MLKFEAVIEGVCAAFRNAQVHSERFECEVWIQYNPKTGVAIHTDSTIIAAARRECGFVDVGRYISGELMEV